MAGKKGKGGAKTAKIKEAMSKYGTRVEGNYAAWGSKAVGMDGPAKLIIEKPHRK